MGLLQNPPWASYRLFRSAPLWALFLCTAPKPQTGHTSCYAAWTAIPRATLLCVTPHFWLFSPLRLVQAYTFEPLPAHYRTTAYIFVPVLELCP